MAKKASAIRFKARLLQPAKAGRGAPWCFLVLPKDASAQLPRRGRTSVEGTLDDAPFQATLEPDGQRSHWLKVDKALATAAGVTAGDEVALDIQPMASEPEPKLPADFRKALAATPQAQAAWSDTTTIARVDWIHWITSAKQTETRATRIANACDMLASGKKRVCCFDPSGFYSKAFSAPEAVDQTIPD